jgi:hypothetical protein
MSCTTAIQQGPTAAAGARSWSVLGGRMWNATVAMDMTPAFGGHKATATKRPARHLGGTPT